MPGENEKYLQSPKVVAKKIEKIIYSNEIYKGDVIDLIKL